VEPELITPVGGKIVEVGGESNKCHGAAPFYEVGRGPNRNDENGDLMVTRLILPDAKELRQGFFFSQSDYQTALPEIYVARAKPFPYTPRRQREPSKSPKQN
jgi:hypothetical protein